MATRALNRTPCLPLPQARRSVTCKILSDPQWQSTRLYMLYYDVVMACCSGSCSSMFFSTFDVHVDQK